MAQVPGLRVVIPSDPYDAKGLLASSIRSDDPVFFLEHMRVYRSFRQEVPDESYTVPLDKAAVKREGSDVTIISYGYMVRESLNAAEDLAKEGINAEVLDLRTVSPLDEETILNEVKKTGRGSGSRSTKASWCNGLRCCLDCRRRNPFPGSTNCPCFRTGYPLPMQ